MKVAVDIETTGETPGYHEIIQIAVQPLDDNFDPEGEPFYVRLRPEHPERADPEAMAVSGLSLDDPAVSQERGADLLYEYFQRWGGRAVVPLAHNWSFERGFLGAWLGEELFARVFFGHARDSMLLAVAYQDRAAISGAELPFESIGLDALCKQFGIVNEKPHDALSDAITGAKLYRALLTGSAN